MSQSKKPRKDYTYWLYCSELSCKFNKKAMSDKSIKDHLWKMHGIEFHKVKATLKKAPNPKSDSAKPPDPDRPDSNLTQPLLQNLDQKFVGSARDPVSGKRKLKRPPARPSTSAASSSATLSLDDDLLEQHLNSLLTGEESIETLPLEMPSTALPRPSVRASVISVPDPSKVSVNHGSTLTDVKPAVNSEAKLDVPGPSKNKKTEATQGQEHSIELSESIVEKLTAALDRALLPDARDKLIKEAIRDFKVVLLNITDIRSPVLPQRLLPSQPPSSVPPPNSTVSTQSSWAAQVERSRTTEEILSLPWITDWYEEGIDGQKTRMASCIPCQSIGWTVPESDTMLNDKGKTVGSTRLASFKARIKRHCQEKDICSAGSRRYVGHTDKAKVWVEDLAEKKKNIRKRLFIEQAAKRNCALAAMVCLKYHIPMINYEQIVVMLDLMDVEVGDNQLCEKFAADFRDVTFTVMIRRLKETMEDMSHGFILPFSISMDKDTSKGRKRCILIVRVIVIDDQYDRPCVQTYYIGHPACTTFTGLGIARLILNYLTEVIGLDKQYVMVGLRNASYDGEFLKLRGLEHILREAGMVIGDSEEDQQLFYSGHPEFWDPSHEVELVDSKSETDLIKQAITTFSLTTAWFRIAKNNEELRVVTAAEKATFFECTRVATMKFVGNQVAAAEKQLKMRPCQLKVLLSQKNRDTSQEMELELEEDVVVQDDSLGEVTRKVTWMKSMNAGQMYNRLIEDSFKFSFLGSLELKGMLAEFSTFLQSNDNLVHEFINSLLGLKKAVGEINLLPLVDELDNTDGMCNEVTRTILPRFVDGVTKTSREDWCSIPAELERAAKAPKSKTAPSNKLPAKQSKGKAKTVKKLTVAPPIPAGRDDVIRDMQQYVDNLAEYLDHYFFQDNRYKAGSADSIFAAAAFLNEIEQTCQFRSRLDDTPKLLVRQFHIIYRAELDFPRLRLMVPATVTRSDINAESFGILLEQLKKCGASTLQEGYKRLMTTKHHKLVPSAMKSLMTNILVLCISEASCEGFGSKMEKKHTTQYFKSKMNDDMSCMKALFIDANAPHTAQCEPLIEKVLQEMPLAIMSWTMDTPEENILHTAIPAVKGCLGEGEEEEHCGGETPPTAGQPQSASTGSVLV